MTEQGSSDHDYAERLGDVLARRDPEGVRSFLVENARRYGDEGQVAAITGQSAENIEALMHRMIVARPDLADLHPESQAWLASHGLDRPRPQSKPTGTPTRSPRRLA